MATKTTKRIENPIEDPKVEYANLEAELAARRLDVANVEAEREALEAGPVSRDVVAQLSELRFTFIKVLEGELVVIERLGAAFPAFHDIMAAEFAAQQGDPHAALENKKAEILATLVKLGWHECAPDAQDPCRVTPGVILSHPDVRRLYGETLKTVPKFTLPNHWPALATEVENKIVAVKKKILAAL